MRAPTKTKSIHGPQPESPSIKIKTPTAQCSHVERVLGKWGREGVLGWFSADSPFRDADRTVLDDLAALVGASPTEVVAMNALTVNLHLLLVAFYRPREGKYKIIVEDGAFPSDMVSRCRCVGSGWRKAQKPFASYVCVRSCACVGNGDHSIARRCPNSSTPPSSIHTQTNPSTTTARHPLPRRRGPPAVRDA